MRPFPASNLSKFIQKQRKYPQTKLKKKAVSSKTPEIKFFLFKYNDGKNSTDAQNSTFVGKTNGKTKINWLQKMRSHLNF